MINFEINSENSDQRRLREEEELRRLMEVMQMKRLFEAKTSANSVGVAGVAGSGKTEEATQYYSGATDNLPTPEDVATYMDFEPNVSIGSTKYFAIGALWLGTNVGTISLYRGLQKITDYSTEGSPYPGLLDRIPVSAGPESDFVSPLGLTFSGGNRLYALSIYGILNTNSAPENPSRVTAEQSLYPKSLNVTARPGFYRLFSIILSDTGFTDTYLAGLLEYCPQLRELTLFSNDDLELTPTLFPHLTDLSSIAIGLSGETGSGTNASMTDQQIEDMLVYLAANSTRLDGYLSVLRPGINITSAMLTAKAALIANGWGVFISNG